MTGAHEPLRLFEGAAEGPAVGAKAASAEGSLRAVAEAARLVAKAQARFVAAVHVARTAGCSWRQIGTAAGVPYQNLHRSFADNGNQR